MIGNFSRNGDSHTGTITTMMHKTKATIKPGIKKTDNSPEYRIYAASGTEIGAGWKKLSNGGREYLSIRLDDPSFVKPINCHLINADDEQLFLIWSR